MCSGKSFPHVGLPADNGSPETSPPFRPGQAVGLFSVKSFNCNYLQAIGGLRLGVGEIASADESARKRRGSAAASSVEMVLSTKVRVIPRKIEDRSVSGE